MVCNICSKGISEKVSSYSKGKFGVELCFDHQKTYQNLPKTNESVYKPVQSELVADEEFSGQFFSGEFKGMIFKMAVDNALEFEKTYEDVKRNLPQYYDDLFKIAVEITKRR